MYRWIPTRPVRRGAKTRGGSGAIKKARRKNACLRPAAKRGIVREGAMHEDVGGCTIAAQIHRGNGGWDRQKRPLPKTSQNFPFWPKSGRFFGGTRTGGPMAK